MDGRSSCCTVTNFIEMSECGCQQLPDGVITAVCFPHAEIRKPSHDAYERTAATLE